MDVLAAFRMDFVMFGSVMGCLALIAIAWRLAFFRRRLKARAVITSVVLGARVKSGSGSTGRSRTVKVRYETAEGESINAEDSWVIGRVREGDEVTVYYDPSIPHDVAIADFFRFWFLALLFLVLSVAFLGAALSTVPVWVPAPSF